VNAVNLHLRCHKRPVRPKSLRSRPTGSERSHLGRRMQTQTNRLDISLAFRDHGSTTEYVPRLGNAETFGAAMTGAWYVQGSFKDWVTS
jgi:hypothetical protein